MNKNYGHLSLALQKILAGPIDEKVTVKSYKIQALFFDEYLKMHISRDLRIKRTQKDLLNQPMSTFQKLFSLSDLLSTVRNQNMNDLLLLFEHKPVQLNLPQRPFPNLERVYLLIIILSLPTKTTSFA